MLNVWNAIVKTPIFRSKEKYVCILISEKGGKLEIEETYTMYLSLEKERGEEIKVIYKELSLSIVHT